MQRPLRQENWEDEQLPRGGVAVGAKTRINKILRVRFTIGFLAHLADKMTGKGSGQKKSTVEFNTFLKY